MTHDLAKLSLIVHGGAGLIPEEERPLHATGLQHALDEGWARLQQGETALSAVAAAIEVLENHPIFDAGLGSVLRLDGSIAMDAAIMDGGWPAAEPWPACRAVPIPYGSPGRFWKTRPMCCSSARRPRGLGRAAEFLPATHRA